MFVHLLCWTFSQYNHLVQRGVTVHWGTSMFGRTPRTVEIIYLYNITQDDQNFLSC